MKRLKNDVDFIYLTRLLKKKGYFERHGWIYFFRFLFACSTLVICYYIMLFVGDKNVLIPGLICLGFTYTALPYIAHDGGHGAITDTNWINESLGYFAFTIINGQSFTWWMHSHNMHHDFVNECEEDPALQFSLFVSDFPKAVLIKKGWRRKFPKWQAFYFIFLFPFHHFSMVFDGWKWMLKNIKLARIELALYPLFIFFNLIVPIYFLGLSTALTYYLITKVIGSICITATFNVHHIGRTLYEKGEKISAFRQAVEGTRTINTWPIFDFYYHGLNFHIEHHIFPNIPSWKLRSLNKIVKEYCERKKITYVEKGFWASQKDVFTYLYELGNSKDPYKVKYK